MGAIVNRPALQVPVEDDDYSRIEAGGIVMTVKTVARILSALLILSGLLAGCAPAPEPSPSPTLTPAPTPMPTPTPDPEPQVGVVLPTEDEPRWRKNADEFRKVIGEAGYTCEILYSQNDSNIEKTNVESLIAKGIEVLIICPHDATAAGMAAETAKAAGVKVINYDRLIMNTDAVDYYVAFDRDSECRIWTNRITEIHSQLSTLNSQLFSPSSSPKTKSST